MKRRQKISLAFLTITTIIIISFQISPAQTYSEKLNSGNKKVAAFYYGWYSNTTDYSQTGDVTVKDDRDWRHWNMAKHGWYPPTNACSVNTPLYGWYDSADPAVIEEHLKMAEWAGIDSFVVSYWGQQGFEFDNFKTMLDVARDINSNMTFSLYFEIFMNDLDKMPDEEAIDFMVNEFEAIYEVFTLPENEDYIWKEDGKPVLFSYVSRSVSAQVWTQVSANMSAQNKEFFHMADRPGTEENYNKHFGGSHQYDCYAPIHHGTYFKDIFGIKRAAKKFDQIFAAPVAPGYNDTVVRDGNEPESRDGGDFYQMAWEKAISLNPDWITITSWNEWHEGTEIEPSVENGDLALNQTRQFVSQFKSGEYTTLDQISYFSNLTNVYFLLGLIGAWVILGGFILVKSLQDMTLPSQGPWKVLSLVHLVPFAGVVYLLTLANDLNGILDVILQPWVFMIPGLVLLQNIILTKCERSPHHFRVGMNFAHTFK